VFVEFAKLGAGVKHYPVYILLALVLFQFFTEITTGSVSALVEREGLLRKVRFPRMVIPLSVLLTAVLNLGGTLAAAVIFAGLSGAYPTWGWLQLPLFIGIVGAFAMGLGMLLGALFVRYRDIKPIWDVVSQTLFYASPILYVTTTVPEAYQHAYAANPLAATFAQMRHAMLDPAAPTAWEPPEAPSACSSRSASSTLSMASAGSCSGARRRGSPSTCDTRSRTAHVPSSATSSIYLRSRVQELERELTEQAARANTAIAAAQERAVLARPLAPRPQRGRGAAGRRARPRLGAPCCAGPSAGCGCSSAG
jgi:hypothetical protein